MDQNTEHRRIAVLDGLRALAITLVVLRHSLKPYFWDFSKPFLPVGSYDAASFMMNGWVGVDLFFVLSGFLITRQLLMGNIAAPEKRRELITGFYKKRFFRIAPAYYLVLTLFCLGIFPPFPLHSPRPLLWRYVYHLLFLQDYFPADIGPIFWSLAIEMKFYLLAPFLLMGLLRLPEPRLRYGAIGLLLVLSVAAKIVTALTLLHGMNDAYSYFAQMRDQFHLTLDGLLCGLLCALLWHDPAMRAKLSNPVAANTLFFSGLCLFLGLASFYPPLDTGVTFFDKTCMPPIMAFAFACMMLGLLGGCRGHSLFMARPLRGIALVSYSIYLIHFPIVILSYFIAAHFMPGGDPQSPLHWLISLPSLVFLCGICSMALYFCVEKPFIDWAKRPAAS